MVARVAGAFALPEVLLFCVGEDAVEGPRVKERLSAIVGERAVVGFGVWKQCFRKPDAFKAFSADRIDKAGGDARAERLARFVDQQDLLADADEFVRENRAGQTAAENEGVVGDGWRIGAGCLLHAVESFVAAVKIL